MPTKLTKAVVVALKPKERPCELRDTQIKGFLVRIEVGGTKTFWLRYAFGGKRSCRFKLGVFGNVSVEGARELARAAAGEVAKGIDPAQRRRDDRRQRDRDHLLELRRFLDSEYEPWATTHMKSAAVQLKRIRSDFADQLDEPMTALHQLAIERIRQKWRKGGVQARTINRDIQRLQSVLSRAVEWGVLDRHPLKGMKPMKFDKTGRVRFLSAIEETALRDGLNDREDRLRAERMRYNTWRIARHLDPLPDRAGDLLDNLKPMVMLAINTGMRRGELFSLKWANVDLTAGIVTVHAASAKSGQTRRIPLNSEASAVLAAWRDRQTDHDGYVFPGADGARLNNIAKAWGGVVKLAKLTDFNFHDLRHTFASRLVQASVDLNTVRTLLGHSQISTTLIYAHLARDNLRAAVEKVVS